MTVHKPFIITIVGPESSGKTTLARQLAADIGCPWVPEYARQYLEELGRVYDEVDLKLIADRQLEDILRVSSEHRTIFPPAPLILRSSFTQPGPTSQHPGVKNSTQLAVGSGQLTFGYNAVLAFQREEFGENGRPIVIVDSGMMSLRMWARIKYGSEIPIVEEALKEDITSMYILCRPLIPWEADPLREAPLLLDRAWIYNHYLKELSAIQAK